MHTCRGPISTMTFPLPILLIIDDFMTRSNMKNDFNSPNNINIGEYIHQYWCIRAEITQFYWTNAYIPAKAGIFSFNVVNLDVLFDKRGWFERFKTSTGSPSWGSCLCHIPAKAGIYSFNVDNPIVLKKKWSWFVLYKSSILYPL